METTPAIVPDNQPWSSDTEADASVANEKPRRRNRSRRRKRNIRLSETAPNTAEQAQEVELPFTIWDRTNPDQLIDPNKKETMETLPVEQASEITKEHKVQKEDTKHRAMPESPHLESAELEEHSNERQLEGEQAKHDEAKESLSKLPEAPEPQPEESEALRQARLQVGKQLEEAARQIAGHTTELAPEDKEVTPEAPAPSSVSAEKQTAETPKRPGQEIDMAREDLMAIGNSIMIEGVSLAEMFRAKRIDEAGLRRVVAAFLRGEDVRKILANEIVRFQMRFERDPRLRDNLAPRRSTPRASHRAAKKVAGHAKTALAPQRIKQGASKASNSLLEGIDRVRETAVDNPRLAKNAAVAIAVLAYFVILILIIRS